MIVRGPTEHAPMMRELYASLGWELPTLPDQVVVCDECGGAECTQHDWAVLTCERIELGLRTAGAEVSVVRATPEGGFLHASLGDRLASIDIYYDAESLAVLVFAGTGDVVSPEDDCDEFHSPGPGIAGAVLEVVLGSGQREDQESQ